MTPFPMPALNAVGAIDDALLFVSVSMILLALVAVVAWDGLALDARDEAILGPLPIPRATIVARQAGGDGRARRRRPARAERPVERAARQRGRGAAAGQRPGRAAPDAGARDRLRRRGRLRLLHRAGAARGVSRRPGPVVAGGVDAPAGAADRRAGHHVPAHARLDGTRRRAHRPGGGRLAHRREPADVVRRPAPGARRPRRRRHPGEGAAAARPGRRGSVGGALRPGAARRRPARAHGARGPGRVVRRRRRGLPVERPEAGGARPHAAARRRAAAIPLGPGWSPPRWPGRPRSRPASSSRCGRWAAASRIARRWPWPRRSAWRWRPSASVARCARRPATRRCRRCCGRRRCSSPACSPAANRRCGCPRTCRRPGASSSPGRATPAATSTA